MAIFTLENCIDILNEMKSKEEYSRESFKKKYKFTQILQDPIKVQ